MLNVYRLFCGRPNYARIFDEISMQLNYAKSNYATISRLH